MAAGGPGDHPVIDIVNYKLDVYNAQCDALIREISSYISQDRLFQMYDWLDEPSLSKQSLEEFERSLTLNRDQLRLEAIERGWEVD